MNFLITGAAGFIGSNFIDYLIDRTNYKIIGLDRLSYASDIKNISHHMQNNSNRFSFINANMNDEEIYEYKVSDFGLASAIIYGADPRYSSKFSGSYTSSMIMYDVIALIKYLQENYKDPKEVILMGSSTGSLAIFKAAWSDYLDKYPSISKISKVFMINAACPDTFDATLRGDIEIFAINGKEDDSTP